MKFPNLPDNIIEQALALYDQGKPVSAIIAAFPDHKAEVEDLFGFVSEIRHEGRQLPLPSRDALTHVLLSVSMDTQKHVAQKSPTASFGTFESFQSFVTGRWTVYGSVGVVAAMAFIIFINNFSATNQPIPLSPNDTKVAENTQQLVRESSVAQDAQGIGAATETASPTALMASPAMKSAGTATAGSDAILGAFFADASAEQALFDTEATAILANVDGATLTGLDTTIASYAY